MKIECDKCQAKYSIADEKVRGKTFKIRCKKCSNVIIVRDKVGGAADVNLGATPGTATEGGAVWHVAIDGETVGPLSEPDVRRRFESGEIDQHTSVWQEGFEDWVELRTVDEFSDLAHQSSSLFGDAMGGSLGTDSSPSFGQASSFASPSGDLSFGSQASTGSASPRVTELTGQRNENSVLFSLENLQKLASTGGSAPAAEVHRPSLAAPSTSVPTSEGSGLIDIRSMGVMLGNDGPKETRRADEDILPSFGGSGFGGLAAQPLVAEGPPVGTYGSMPPSQPRSMMPVVAAVVVAGFAIAGAIFFGLRQPTAPSSDESVLANAPKLDDLDSKDGKSSLVVPTNDEESSDDGEKDDEDDEQSDHGEDNGESSQTDRKKSSKSSGSSKRSSSKKSSDRGGSKSSSSSKSSSKDGEKSQDSEKSDSSKEPASKSSSSKSNAESKPTPASDDSSSDDSIDVDCLIDPSKCRKSSKGKSKSSSKTKKPAVDPNLPEKLNASSIHSGINKVKAAAMKCGKQHGAAAGSKVPVRISVEGATGKVLSAVATGDYAGKAVGKCVASQAKKATFPRFQEQQQGFAFRFKM